MEGRSIDDRSELGRKGSGLTREEISSAVGIPESGTRKAVHLTLVVSPELKKNAYANDIQSTVALDDLFRE